jgi:U1 small nuclear ribonucleoprotein
MRQAYKVMDGVKIDGRRISVDVERGRTVKDWKPRRLGGGLGNVRDNAPRPNGRVRAVITTGSQRRDSYRDRRPRDYDRPRDHRDRDFGHRGGDSGSSYRDRDRDRGRDAGRRESRDRGGGSYRGRSEYSSRDDRVDGRWDDRGRDRGYSRRPSPSASGHHGR